MSLARDLSDLEAKLRASRSVDPFLPIGKSQILAAPDCAATFSRLAAKGQMDSLDVMRLCLQALRIQYSTLESRLIKAEFVATLPIEVPASARPTQSVIREMVSHASEEIILLGYEFTDEELLDSLIAASSRGVEAVLICDRSRGAVNRILADWPDAIRKPRLFHDRDRADAAAYASMHAKSLLIDQDDLLITSANFTFHGLKGNIEMGIRLSGQPAREARRIFSYLVESNVVEECEWPTQR